MQDPASQTDKSDSIDFGFEDIPKTEKISRVKSVFDSVAPKYDLMNDAMSLGIHRLWKSMAITTINPQPGEVLLDVAGGTGDLARRFIHAATAVQERRGGAAAQAIICDINQEMLRAGGDNLNNHGLDLQFICGNAEQLPFDSEQFDVVTIAFGIRNVTDREAALKEFQRVLKPGGRLAILEFSTPPTQWLRAFYDAYSFNVIPPLGGILAGDKPSYQYLVESIRRFPRQNAFAEMIKAAGFSKVSYQDYSGGIAALHRGWKL